MEQKLIVCLCFVKAMIDNKPTSSITVVGNCQKFGRGKSGLSKTLRK